MENYSIIRTQNAGVFFGIVAERNGSEATLKNVRRLWRWSGASECLQLAAEGVKFPHECKFTMVVPEIVVLGIIEIHPCSPAATKSLQEVPEWKS